MYKFEQELHLFSLYGSEILISLPYFCIQDDFTSPAAINLSNDNRCTGMTHNGQILSASPLNSLSQHTSPCFC